MNIECSCKAQLVMTNLSADPNKLILIVLGVGKHGQLKSSDRFEQLEKKQCLWCGKKWPDNLIKIIKDHAI